jgi:hypothetical protein
LIVTDAQIYLLIAPLVVLTTSPHKSNRQVAKTAGVDHKTVAAIRAEVEAIGEIPQSDRVVAKERSTSELRGWQNPQNQAAIQANRQRTR